MHSRRPRVERALLAVAAGLVLLVSACRVEQNHEAGTMALVFGELQADRQRDCLSLGGVSTVWPEGFEVGTDPLRLVGPRGRTVGEPGDSLRFSGGAGTGSESLPPGSCRVGDEVSVLNEFLGKGLPEGVK